MDAKLSKERWVEIEQALDSILDQPEEEQLNFLQQRFSSNRSLYNDIKKLLFSNKNSPDILEHPAINVVNTLIENPGKDTEVPDLVNACVGAYRLKKEIGRGGMGVVYQAERTDGAFEQEVAIKLLWNWQGKSVNVERFAHEQQVLATLKHPNIAQIFDSGMSGSGQPYFVMEYVSGQTITTYCDHKALTIDQRLNLLMQVMEALSFSHKNLIVHRDIKPNNILVNEEGKVKLLDFGIAKLLGDRAQDLTHTGEHLMTPGFASPEQLKNRNITVATDIYLLGLLMYELITGQQAFRDRANSFITLAKLMCEQQPTAPSTLVKSLKSSKQLSTHRDKGNEDKAKKLRGDLDAIVLKALSPETHRRYASMDALIQDITAYFDHRPVAAHKRAFTYIASKFIRRYWRILLISGLFFTLLVSYAATTTWQKREIELNLQRIALEKRKAQRVSDFLINIFKSADPNVSALSQVTADEILEQGRLRLQKGLGDSPEIYTYMLTTLGEIYLSQGNHQKSAQLLEDSVTEQRKLNRTNSLSFANSITQLAAVYILQREHEKAEVLLQESFAIHKGLSNSEQNAEYAETHYTYGRILWRQGRTHQAEDHFKKALHILRHSPGDNALGMGLALSDLANVQSLHGQFEEAEKNMRSALHYHEQRLGAKHSYYSRYLTSFSTYLIDYDRVDEAEKYIHQALTIQREILEENHPYLSITLRTMGYMQHRQGRLSEAQTSLKQALHISQENMEKGNFTTAVIYMRLGAVLQDQEKYSEAASAYKNMMDIYSAILADGQYVGRGLCQLASLAYAQGELLRAQQTYEKALEMLPESSLRQAMAQVGYARVLIDSNAATRAEQLARKALATMRLKFPLGHSMTAEAEATLGLALFATKNQKEALTHLHAAYTVLRKRPNYSVGHRHALLQRVRTLL